MADRVSAGQGETAEQDAKLLRDVRAQVKRAQASNRLVELLPDEAERLLVRVQELTDGREHSRRLFLRANDAAVRFAEALEDSKRRVQEAERALREAIEIMQGDDYQIHSEWGVGPYEEPEYLPRFRAVLGGDGQQEHGSAQPPACAPDGDNGP